MDTTTAYRITLALLVALVLIGIASCGDAGAPTETIAGTTVTPTPTATPTPTPMAERDLVEHQEPPAPEAVECEAPGHGARLVVADLGDRRFRVDLVLDGMGLPVGRFWVLEEGERRHLAGFPERPQGPPPAAEVLALTSGTVGASVTVEVPVGTRLEVVADVHGEVRGVAEHEGRCQEFWHFTTAGTEPVLVG